MNDYKNNSSYRTMDNLFNSQRDFIVIGLCGLTGSGCTEIANILQKDLEEWELPQPDSCPRDVLLGDDFSDVAIANDSPEMIRARHEYRLLHTHAQKNWSKFHRIKVSALITAHILQAIGDEDPLESFEKFLSGLLNLNEDDQNPEINEICDKFFNREMVVTFNEVDSKTNIATLLKENNAVSEIKLIKIEENESFSNRLKATAVNNEKVTSSKREIVIHYKQIDNTLILFNRELYGLFQHYGELRRNKAGYSNSLWYWILKRYIYELLPEATVDMWKALQDGANGLSSLALQQIGINLRISRKPFDRSEEEFESNGYEIIAEDINLAIKLLGAYQQNQMLTKDSEKTIKHTLVVIDSIKNPFESMYLKRRYSNYYLVGVCTDESERERRLLKERKFSSQDIEEIDQIERLSEFKRALKMETDEKKKILNNLIDMMRGNASLYRELPFVFQNVERCLDAADIFVNNVYDERDSRLRLKKVLLRYISLIMYPGLVLPTPIENCMQTAYTAKLNSGCISRQVGAVITDADFHILSIGWNQQPERQLPCSYRDLCELCKDFTPDAYSDYENGKKFQGIIKDKVRDNYACKDNPLNSQGRLPIFCFKDIHNHIKGEENQVHTRALHGEETAFLNLDSSGKEHARGGCLFTTSSPCELCAKKAMYMGISRIYYVEPYAGISAAQVLHAGPMDKRPKLILLTGAVGRAYMQLYTPLMPLKDEHEMWMGDEPAKILFPKDEAKKSSNGENRTTK